MSALCQSAVPAVGSRQRFTALPLHRLPAHVQRIDRHPAGPSTQEGALGGANRGPDHRGERDQSRQTLRRRRCSTAFRWRHRFLAAAAFDKPARLSGIVEADETFILESFKGKRSDLPRAARKRGGQAAKRGLSAEQIPILRPRPQRCHDRRGSSQAQSGLITAALEGVVTSDNQLCCDGGKAIVGFARKQDIPCQILPSPGGPRPEAPNLHINNVNGYHGRLKEWLRPFHGVATKYLDHYLGWRRTIEVWRDNAQPANWLLSAVGIAQCQ